MSPISSRNSVPPSAFSNRPRLLACAPVKAPRTWPNSSLSSRPSGIAVQLIGTKGFSERSPWKWMARATTSLPVPLSPVISTRAARVRDALDQREDLAHRRALADQLAERAAAIHRAAQLLVLLERERAVRERALDREDHGVGLEGLGQVVEGAAAHRLDGRVDRAEGGHQHHRRAPGAGGGAGRPARRPRGPACARPRARRRSPARRRARGRRRREAASSTQRPRSLNSEASISRMARSSSTTRSWRALDMCRSPEHGACQARTRPAAPVGTASIGADCPTPGPAGSIRPAQPAGAGAGTRCRSRRCAPPRSPRGARPRCPATTDEPEAAALAGRLGGVERLEHALEVAGRDAVARVRDAHLDLVARAAAARRGARRPRGIASAAFRNRFRNTCCSRSGSPATLGAGAKSRVTRISRRASFSVRKASVLSSSAARSTGTRRGRPGPRHVEQALDDPRDARRSAPGSCAGASARCRR